MSAIQELLIEGFVKKTISKCLVCETRCPAEVISQKSQDGKELIVMRRTCPQHGTTDVVIGDAKFYWHAEGPVNKEGCGCGPGKACCVSPEGKDGTLGKNATAPDEILSLPEQLSTCLALIEIVDSCNLKCPTCFAASPHGIGVNTKFHSFDFLTGNIDSVIGRKHKIEILQFSGGEPTIHPEFFRLVQWVIAHPHIEVLLINTNGVRLASDPEFMKEFGKIMMLENAAQKIQLYLQYDGPQLAGQKELRGADLRAMRTKAIRGCEEIGLPITLAMTVTRLNLDHLWEATEFAIPFENIRGISFQPEFLAGRNPGKEDASHVPINVADVINGLVTQSHGKIMTDDFTTLPCGDPNCAIIGWGFRMMGRIFSPKKFGVEISKIQASLRDRIHYNLEDLKQCGCENSRLGDIMKRLENPIARAFRFFIKPFMDKYSWDDHRLARCCTHVITPDRRLVSFCEYYSS
ncbi:MAG: radical SAM protein [Patescibacteria group bacterium]